MKSSIVNIKCPNCFKHFDFIIPMKMPRSNRQNKYFHSVIVPIISEYLGYSLEETKDLLKSMFLKDYLIIKTKSGMTKEICIVRGSSELKTDEFETFMEDCRRWGSMELGLNIPLPNEEIK